MYFPELLAEYRQLLQQMKAEGVTSGSMYQEVKQAIEWMETGYDPAEYRAATRVDAYPMDPYHMQSYVSYLNSDDEMLLPEYLQTVRKKIISDFFVDVDRIDVEGYLNRFFSEYARLSTMTKRNKQKINDMLEGLTANEKAVFIAIKAEKITYRKVAAMFGIEKRSVECYLKRAIAKIEANKAGIQPDLFSNLEIA